MLKDRIVFTNILINLVVVQAAFWLIFLNLKRLPPVIPLFYIFNTPEQVLAPLNLYWLLPAVAAVSFALNLALAKLLYKKDEILSRLLLSVASAVSVLLLLAALQILRAVLY